MSDDNGGFFCSNERCALHVPHRPGQNWAELPDGRMFGRSTKDGRALCDACLKDPRNPVRINTQPEGES